MITMLAQNQGTRRVKEIIVGDMSQGIGAPGRLWTGGSPGTTRRCRLFAACLLLSACNADSPSSPVALEVNGAPSRQVSASVGQELSIRLQTVGPGNYASPPTVEGTAVTFLDASFVGPQVPAGVTQVFRFKAVKLGRAILVFHNPSQNRTVSDTVLVH